MLKIIRRQTDDEYDNEYEDEYDDEYDDEYNIDSEWKPRRGNHYIKAIKIL